MIKKILLSILAIIGILALYLLFYPVDIEPVAYTPPPNPKLTGAFTQNNKLSTAELLLHDIGTGPEDIAIGLDSLLYTGLEDGRIIQFSQDGKQQKEFINTGGRPLGMKFDKNGNLIVADEHKGLISIDQQGKMTILTNKVNGEKITFADDLDITSNGIIYFSDASRRNGSEDIEKEVWELQPTGRLLSYNPTTKETKVELDGMRFANGVAIGPNDEYLLVNETFGMKINKFWLKGDKKGTHEVFVNELPGYPDNISFNGKDIFWLAMPDLRINDEFEQLYDKPFMRKVIRRLPESMRTAKTPEPYGIIVGINTSGEIVHNFQDTTAKCHALTSAKEFNGTLYLGSIRMKAVGKFKK